MDKGNIRIGATMLGSYIQASHGVEREQWEPNVAPANQPGEHRVDITALELDLDAQVALHRRFALEGLLPIRATLIRASFRDQAGASLPDFQSIHHRTETIAGLGDLVLGGRIAVVLPEDVPRLNVALRAGTSIPVGKIERDPFALGRAGKDHQHMFFGNGTFDPVFGVDTSVAFDKWALVGWTVARTPLYANRFGYRGSKVVVGAIGAISGFGLERWSFLLQPEVYFETPAQWSESPARNSGRTSLLATGGLFFLPAGGWQIHMLAKVPYYTRAHGGQLRWPIVGMLGFAYTFGDARG